VPSEGEQQSICDDVTLVLVARGSDAANIAGWLHLAGQDTLLSRLSIVVWTSPEDVDAIRTSTAQGQVPFRIVATTGGDPRNAQENVRTLLGEIDTPYFAVVPATKARPRLVVTTRKRIRTSRRLTPHAQDPATVPMLLATQTCPRAVLAHYLGLALRAEDEHSQETVEYLGHLAMQTVTASVEAVDPVADGIHVLVRLNFGPLQTEHPPRWRFRVSLRAVDGREVTSEPAVLEQRVGMYGDTRWEHAWAFVRLTEAASGEFRVIASLDSTTWGRKSRREPSPNIGVLLDARPTCVYSSSSSGSTVARYLVHTTGAAKTTRLTLQQDKGAGSDRQWRRILLKKDLRMIARGGAPRKMRALTLLRLMTSPVLKNRRVWLLGERTGTAQDNGFHLFRHLRTQHPRRHVYYVMDRTSPHYDRVKPYGRVVQHSSLRHRLLMLHAAVLADAYSISYLIPRQWDRKQYARHLAWRVGALRIYLKHGVHMSPNALKRGMTGYDMVLTVGPRETESLAVASGYRAQLTEVGLPRYDALVPTPPTRTILFMSTWRRYLVPKVFGGENKDQTPYEGSTYERFMAEFLRNGRLHEILDTHGYRLVFLPHHNLASHFANYATGSDLITIADTEETSFQDLLRRCDAFITDHSSVNFDVAYLGTPMIYARFDAEEFERRHVAPSWFDHERDGFGPVTYDLPTTLDELEKLLERGCAQDDKYARRIREMFSHRDQHNCERVVAAIDRLEKVDT